MRHKVNPFKHHLSKWPIVLPLYDGRQCPHCSAVVFGWQAQQLHQQHHDDLRKWMRAVQQITAALAVAGLIKVRAQCDDDDDDLDDDDSGGGEAPPLGGMVIGSGQLPDEMRGGND